MYKLSFYVPEIALNEVKSALFDVGVGRIGNYDCCCWQVKGEGQFRPLGGSQPYIGSHNEIEMVDEYKVEMICEDHIIEQAVSTLKQAHPYEEPAYETYRILTHE